MKAQMSTSNIQQGVSDEQLIDQLPGFTNHSREVNGVRLHYVIGGKGEPLVLLPGWPETWWSYHKVMPLLAAHYTVIVVDIRGMGSSEKPQTGYDKKNMAKDIHELVQSLGYQHVLMCGHDIGAMVAYSFAENYPDATSKLVMLDVPHPDVDWYKIPLIPAPGQITDKVDESHGYRWWFALHQIEGMTEDLMPGRVHIEHDWIFHYLLYKEDAVTPFDRAVYVNAYDSRDGVRAGYAWFRAFGQDIEDSKRFQKLTMPVLGIGGPSFSRLQKSLEAGTTNLTMHQAEGSGHFIPEEVPEQTVKYMTDFFSH